MVVGPAPATLPGPLPLWEPSGSTVWSALLHFAERPRERNKSPGDGER